MGAIYKDSSLRYEKVGFFSTPRVTRLSTGERAKPSRDLILRLERVIATSDATSLPHYVHAGLIRGQIYQLFIGAAFGHPAAEHFIRLSPDELIEHLLEELKASINHMEQ